MNTDADKISCLKSIELFKDLKEDELQKIAETLTEKVYPPNTVILREGATGDTMFFIKEGVVEVKKKEPYLGANLTVTILGKGECFGEMALLNENPDPQQCSWPLNQQCYYAYTSKLSMTFL